jgi:hypothetical protein
MPGILDMSDSVNRNLRIPLILHVIRFVSERSEVTSTNPGNGAANN